MKKKPYSYTFDSPKEFFDFAKNITPSDFAKFRNAHEIVSNCETPSEFSGNWKSVCKKFYSSDFDDEASLTDDVINEIDTIDHDETKWRFEQRLVEGDFVDPERFLDGTERCWLGYKRLTKQKPVIRVYINFGGNCSRSSKELAVQGAVGVTFAEIMESIGYPVEIYAVAYTVGMDSSDNDYVEKIRLKSASEYCDFGLVNFMLGNDGVFRNGMFRIDCYRAMKHGYDVSFGLGQSRNASLEILDLSDEERNGSVIVPQIYDIETAKKWLKDTLFDQTKLHNLTYTGQEEYNIQDVA